MAEPGARPPARGRRGEKRAQARRRLMDQGLRLLAERGVHACKVEEITQAAKVGKGTFFTHFASKEAFLAALVAETLGDLGRRLRPLGLAPTDPEGLVAGLGAVHLRYFQLRPAAATVLAQALPWAGEGAAGRELAQSLSAHLDLVAGLLAPACPALAWPAERARELALMLLATALGYFHCGRTAGLAGDTPLELLDRLGRALGRGLAGAG